MIKSLGKVFNPTKAVSSLLDTGEETCVTFEFDHVQHYSTGLSITIAVVCYYNEGELHAAFTTDLDSLSKTIDEQADGFQHAYTNLIEALQLSDINLKIPLKLDTGQIPKPWGREIWYTGIEERGICTIQGVPLPWILDAFATIITGTKKLTPILLKILDPSPREVLGDLYFELHRKKREVYVVTHVDENAWSDSVGEIRLGFNPDIIDDYADEQQFKDAYLTSVNNYRLVRDKIDNRLDEIRSEAQVAEDGLVPAKTVSDWYSKIDPSLLTQEQHLREAMNLFTAKCSLQVGDVIQVNPRVPHSLQHGVRVIEFQTPHYERYILSFAQKVLTQNQWDTKEALDQAQISSVGVTEIQQLSETESLIADFEEFKVTRILLQPGTDETIDADHYCLVISVEGSLTLGKQQLLPEEGYYIPACADPVAISNTGTQPATLLIAQPTQ